MLVVTMPMGVVIMAMAVMAVIVMPRGMIIVAVSMVVVTADRSMGDMLGGAVTVVVMAVAIAVSRLFVTLAVAMSVILMTPGAVIVMVV